MAFDFGLAKKSLRRAVHDTLSVAAIRKSKSTGEMVVLRVRFHEKLVRTGEADAFTGAISEVIQGVDRLVFDNDDLVARSIILQRGDEVEIPSYEMTFTLDVESPDDGAVTKTWLVTRA